MGRGRLYTAKERFDLQQSMKLRACVQPSHPLKHNWGNKNMINERRDTDVFLPDFV